MSHPTVLDPTGESRPAAIERPPRPQTLEGLAVALLDISKPRGDVFLDRLEARLGEAGATVRRYAKPTFSKPAPLGVRKQIAEECGAVIEALAD